MKTWIKRTGLALCGAALVVGGFVVWNGKSHHGDWSAEDTAKVKTRIVEKATDKLDLDASQTQKLGVLADKIILQHQALKGRTDMPTQVSTFIKGGKFDRQGAASLVSEKTQLIQTASPELIVALGDFYDGLKPEQQAKVRGMLEKMKRR
jgi:protein CpxP